MKYICFFVAFLLFSILVNARDIDKSDLRAIVGNMGDRAFFTEGGWHGNSIYKIKEPYYFRCDSITLCEQTLDFNNGYPDYKNVDKSKLRWKHYNKTGLFYRDRKAINDSLYIKIKNGEIIKNAYIEILRLDSLGERRGNCFHILYPIRFENCVINHIYVPNFFIDLYDHNYQFYSDYSFERVDMYLLPKDLEFEDEVYFYSCSIGPFQFINTKFNNSVSLINTFPKTHRYINYEKNFKFTRCDFRKNIIIDYKIGNGTKIINSDTTRSREYYCNKVLQFYYGLNLRDSSLPSIVFSKDNKFRGDIYVNNNDKVVFVDFSTAIFQGDVYLNYNHYDGYGNSDYRNQYNISFYDGKFKKSFYCWNSIFNDLNFKNATFYSKMELHNSMFNDSAQTGFFNSNFRNNLLSVSAHNFELRNINFNPSSIEKITFQFITYSRGYQEQIDNAEENLDQAINFYENLNRQINTLYSDRELLCQKLFKKNERNLNFFKMYYHEKMANFDIQNKAYHLQEYFRLWLIEKTVRFGYDGEILFFRNVLIINIFFTIFYLLFGKKQVVDFFNNDNNNDRLSFIKLFSKSAWLSVSAFINPYFPKKYFQLKNGIFIAVCIEWLLGLVLLILFVIYIASQYSFFKALFGV